MNRCPNGHEQRLGLKCETCGADMSYRQSVSELLELPKVSPVYGRLSILSVGYPKLSLKADYIGEIAIAQADSQTSAAFQVASIRGGSWLDFNKKYLDKLRRWVALVGVARSTDMIVVVDTMKPLSVLALSALPTPEHTAVIAVVADKNSTPVEQNTSYVALSLALKKGLPVIALSQTFEREMLYFTEDRGLVTGGDALSRLLEPILSARDDLMDILERDLKLGIKLHSISALVAGSRAVYGTATNAFLAQSYGISIAGDKTDNQTVHSLVFSKNSDSTEFEKGFGVFRNRGFKSALSAEFRFRETSSQLYDILTIYGMGDQSVFQAIKNGYDAIVKSVPELKVPEG